MTSADSSTHSPLPPKEAGQPQTVFRKYEASIRNTLTIVLEARRGLTAETFFDVADASLLNQNLLADLLHISLKTFQRYRKDNKRLNPATSEHLLKLLALFQQGNEVFGSIDSFNRWLAKPAFGLGNQVPLELLETSGGIDLVMDQLLRIAYGDLA